jgi:ribosomal protein S27AE
VNIVDLGLVYDCQLKKSENGGTKVEVKMTLTAPGCGTRAFLPKKPTSREFCGTCHSKEAKSPREIPRIDLTTHGGRYLCWQCHYPHFPES